MLRCVADPEREPAGDRWRGSTPELPDGTSTGCSASWDCHLSVGLRMAGLVPQRRQQRRQPGGELPASRLLFFSSRSFSHFLLFFSHLFSSSEVSS